jgi:hypothetical protein
VGSAAPPYTANWVARIAAGVAGFSGLGKVRTYPVTSDCNLIFPLFKIRDSTRKPDRGTKISLWGFIREQVAVSAERHHSRSVRMGTGRSLRRDRRIVKKQNGPGRCFRFRPSFAGVGRQDGLDVSQAQLRLVAGFTSWATLSHSTHRSCHTGPTPHDRGREHLQHVTGS